ncbi:L-asparaginase [Onishia taeanensis]|uniref:L-asparaginase n=1 Tax=Onishia taeanensis TaxID=284577 RepID=A0A328XN44_9GAMM|nr:asparaginase [Halomonas taeanensis]RAR59003.1 L-asparaginase [Halomonas taeanensis]
MHASRSPLLVIYTGGTLGMVETPHGLAPGDNFESRLRDKLKTLTPARRTSLPAFDFLATASPIDSSSACPSDWQALAALIEAYQQTYSGIVILHGTDTLSWTASSLAFQLQGIDKAVVVTGAMHPLEAEHSDALANVEGALRFAAQPELQEVALYFAGRLLRGVRTRKWQTQAEDAFISPNYPLLGELVDGAPVLYPGRGLADHQRGAQRFELPDYRVLGPSPVVRITLWPGMTARQLGAMLLDDTVSGALLEVWGGGNIADDPALVEVLAQARGEGKLVAAISQCPQGRIEIGTYAAGQGLMDAEVLSGDDMTPEAAMTKLIHLLAQPLSDAERRRHFLTSLIGER